MRSTRHAARRFAGASALILLLQGVTHPLVAQVPADASWRTIESRYFRVTYEAGLESIARHAAASAERARAALAELVARPPDGTIDIVIADNLDISNGYAAVFPDNRIVIYARPPSDALELQHIRDWIEFVITHELTHIVHLDATSRAGHALRAVFGRVPWSWPVFPALDAPDWNIEGLAVGVESGVTGFGRVNGSYHEMVVRSAALAGRLDDFDRLGSTSVRWPGGMRVYIYGSLFMDYLERRFGADAGARIANSTANAVIPPMLWFGRVGSNALGTSFRDLYRDWQREVITRTDSLASVLRAQGLTEGAALTTHRATALYPRFSRDSRSIVYAAYDWRSPAQLRVIDAVDGTERWSARINSAAPAAWLDDSSVTAGEIDHVDQFRVFSDLHVFGRGSRRITHRARLQDPDVARDGRIVAIQNHGGTNRIVLVDGGSGSMRPVTTYDSTTWYSLPRFSPDGSRIAVARFRNGGAYDIVVIDTVGNMRAVTDAFGVSAAPAWSADGRWILFGSDRSGVPNIYAVDAMAVFQSVGGAVTNPAGTLRQVTNVLGGAFQPDASPDGRWITYAAYHDDGFRIERIPFDTAGWRAPAAPGAAVRIAPRPVQPTDSSRALADSARSALSAADTLAGESRRYSALRSLRPHYWVPIVDVADDLTYIGIATSGRDLVSRHNWYAAFMVDVDGGLTRGNASYTYSGLPTIHGIGLHPSLTAAVDRDWDRTLISTGADAPFLDEREDIATVIAGFTRTRYRTAAALSIGGELVNRSRYVRNDEDSLRLRDARDDLIGVRATASLAHYVAPPFSISRENGFTAQVAVRHRIDRDVQTVVIDSANVVFDAGYTELTTWNTAYVALPFPGFARHVLGLRFSALLRGGTAPPLSSVGGSNTGGFTIPGLAYTIGSSSDLLPLRGVRRGIRVGTDAWTGSLEYRFPIAFVDRAWRFLFIDRFSGAAFVDAGHAWCNVQLASSTICMSASASDAPIVTAGGEIALDGSLFGVGIPLRAGAAVPIRGTTQRELRVYLVSGYSF